MRQISENVYCVGDTCNVYVIRNGREAVLIDFGAGTVLDELRGIGVEHVAAVLMTHHHRDQGQGLARAAAQGIPIWVPHAEQDLFQSVDAHWQARAVMNNYNVRQDRFSLLESVPVAGTLRDYAEYEFGGQKFLVVPTPGHTTGSISVLADVDGQRFAFTGDLMLAPGKVWSLAATQWTYNGAEGVAASIPSLVDLKARRPDVLLPSHGAPIRHTAEAIDLTVSRLYELLTQRGENPRMSRFLKTPYEAITPHLFWNRTSMANAYVLLAQSGKALLIDYGYDFMTGAADGTDRASRRPWLYTLPILKRDFGVNQIDAALATHYHDDHVAGFNLAREVEGTRIWAGENFADVLEHPYAYDLPCLWYDPIPVDRALPLEQPVQWEEYTLTIYPLPGHTLFATAVAFEADGKRVLAAGDQYQGDDGLAWNYVYQNQFRIDDYIQTAELYRRLNPDVIITGHWEPLWVKPGYFDALDARGQTLARLHRELLPLETFDFGAGENVARIQPYQTRAQRGARPEFQLQVRNPFAHDGQATVEIVTPRDWQVAPQMIQLQIPGHASERATFTIVPQADLTVRRARIAVDVTIEGTRFGQQAEALITLE